MYIIMGDNIKRETVRGHIIRGNKREAIKTAKESRAARVIKISAKHYREALDLADNRGEHTNTYLSDTNNNNAVTVWTA